MDEDSEPRLDQLRKCDLGSGLQSPQLCTSLKQLEFHARLEVLQGSGGHSAEGNQMQGAESVQCKRPKADVHVYFWNGEQVEADRGEVELVCR